MSDISSGNGFGGLGKPGVRVSERGGGKANEFDLPLLHAAVIAALIAGVFVIVIPLLMLLIGRGLLLAGVVVAVLWGVWRWGWQYESLPWRLGVIAVGATLLWLWLDFGQGYVEKLWWPVWYGWPTAEGYLPVQVGNDPLAMRLMPGWIVLARLLGVPAVALAYGVTAWLIGQRFGIEILFPQLLAITPQPVKVRARLPRWFSTLEQEREEKPAPKHAPIIVEHIDDAPHEQEVAADVWRSNGTGNSGRRTWLEDVSSEQWDAIAAYVLAGRPWNGPEVGAGRILTTPQYRALTKQLLACKYLRERQPGNPRGGYDWTHGGRKFLQKRLWLLPRQRGEG